MILKSASSLLIVSPELISKNYLLICEMEVIYDLLWEQFLTSEYAKYNERVIGDDGKFTRSLAYSLHHSDVNFSW